MTTISSTTAANLAQYTASVSSLDTNGDGIVSPEEQAAASIRTQDPTVSTDNAASSSTSQLSADMMAMVLAKGDHSTQEASREASRFNAMDTDHDGKVSEAEFVAARPKHMSEEQATKRFEALDTNKTGSLTEQQLASEKMKGAHGEHAHHAHHAEKASGGDANETMGMDELFNKMRSVIDAYRSAGGNQDDHAGVSTAATTTNKDSLIV